jgi:exodeoxyribonuclease V alpha subunit
VGDGIVTLRHSYRHAGSGDVGELARVVNAQQADRLVQGLREGRWQGVRWVATSLRDPIPAALLQEAAVRYRAVRDAHAPAEALRLLGRFRILCAVRRGPAGVERVNRLLEHEILGAASTAGGALDRLGRPLIVTRNDCSVQLFNGDVGLLWPDAQGVLRVVFEGGEGGALRALAPSWLPAHETVYAMTVHKSQGSEFDEVAVLLPPEPAPVLTLELLYTAVTRARSQVVLYAPEPVLRSTVERRVQRSSGLRAALWGEASSSGQE